ncbi:MAG: helicase C-terminal domain-containing protein [Promethearchaeota archaeon]
MSNNLTYVNFFPYRSYRSEQQEIIREIELDTRLKRNVLLIAPSGTGKTIMALSAILPIAYEKGLKVIYLCRTHAQSARVISELKKIHSSKVKISGLSLRGRVEMCLNPAILNFKLPPMDAMLACNELRIRESCIHYNKLHDDQNHRKISCFRKPMDAQELIEYCKENQYCPYYFSKQILKETQVIVCNFQWMFNPAIRFQIFSLLRSLIEDCILVIDECHNVVNMATEVKSDKLTLSFLNSCLEDLKSIEFPNQYTKFINYLIDHLKQKSRELFTTNSIKLDPIDFLKNIYKDTELDLAAEFERLYFILQELPVEKRIELNRLRILERFWQNWIEKCTSNKYFFCYHMTKKGQEKLISLEIVALEPREVTIPLFRHTYACVNLSGTVNPYIYRNLTGLDRKFTGYREIIANSPFKSTNIKALIIKGVTTKLNKRTPLMYKKMIEKIEEVISSTPGNTAIFCASYEILKDLIINGIEDLNKTYNKTIFIEGSEMSGSENAKLLENYKKTATTGKGAILLGVCGGRNSEGEDFPGDYMNSVIIAGVPYHLLTPQANARINYYNKAFPNKGWLFGYLYPAMQRANQAAGRPIRKMKDKGAIIFLDSRFKSKLNWISDWIRKEIEVIPDKQNAISQNLKNFWGK